MSNSASNRSSETGRVRHADSTVDIASNTLAYVFTPLGLPPLVTDDATVRQADLRTATPSTPSHSYYRVEPLQFDASIGGGELPVGFGVMGVASALPCSDFRNEGVFAGDASIETLNR
jgi:hypothetical protein